MTARGKLTMGLWTGLWLFWGVLVLQQILDAARFSAPWPVWIIRVLPLVVFMPGVARDNFRAIIWLCFVLLFYFISAVELIFAQPKNAVAITGIGAVSGLFLICAVYIRTRGRELRQVTGADSAEPNQED